MWYHMALNGLIGGINICEGKNESITNATPDIRQSVSSTCFPTKSRPVVCVHRATWRYRHLKLSNTESHKPIPCFNTSMTCRNSPHHFGSCEISFQGENTISRGVSGREHNAPCKLIVWDLYMIQAFEGSVIRTWPPSSRAALDGWKDCTSRSGGWEAGSGPWSLFPGEAGPPLSHTHRGINRASSCPFCLLPTVCLWTTDSQFFLVRVSCYVLYHSSWTITFKQGK